MTCFQLGTVAEVPRHGTPLRHVWLVTPETQTDIGLPAVIELARANGIVHNRTATGTKENRNERHTDLDNPKPRADNFFLAVSGNFGKTPVRGAGYVEMTGYAGKLTI